MCLHLDGEIDPSTERETVHPCPSGAVKKWNRRMFVLRKILPGCAERSQGVACSSFTLSMKNAVFVVPRALKSR